MPYAHVNGIDLRYETDGSGPPIVLLTGFGGDVAFWKKATEILSDEFTVIRMDNRGAGTASCNEDFTLEDISKDAVALADHLGIREFNVLGWSMGSHIAYNIALSVSDRVKNLILVSSYIYRPARSGYILSAMIDAVKEGMPSEYFGKIMNSICYTEGFFEEREKTGEYIQLPDLSDPIGLRRQLRAVDLSKISEKIDVPTLVIHGEEDIMVDWKEGSKLAEFIPKSEFVLIEGAGHQMPVKKYLPFAIDFIRRH